MKNKAINYILSNCLFKVDQFITFEETDNYIVTTVTTKSPYARDTKGVKINNVAVLDNDLALTLTINKEVL